MSQFALTYKGKFIVDRWTTCYIYFDDNRQIFTDTIYPYDSSSPTYHFTDDHYKRMHTYPDEKKAQRAIKRMKERLIATVMNDDNFYMIHSKVKIPRVFKIPQQDVDAMVAKFRQEVLDKIDRIMADVSFKERVISGYDIVFGGGQELEIHTKKKQTYDRCTACGFKFHNSIPLPYLRAYGSSFCLCKMCLKHYAKEMDKVELPEGFEQDFNRKRLLTNLK